MEGKAWLLAGLFVVMVFAAIVYAATMKPQQAEDDLGGGSCGNAGADGCFADGGGGAVAAPATYAPSATVNRSRELELQAAGEVRTFELGFDWGSGNYEPEEIRVRAGDRVRIEADAGTFTGCMSTLVINGMGISKSITTTDNVLEFTAGTPGRYRLTCGMGMGNGLLVVEDENGLVPEAAPAAPARTGGCGCGG
ncbi:cupredoxin domain-containing protein [Candidatus Micrarchaeota archaeon]|nr:cupredoxin domain-containing protein [Candidatus Micrarchaeota archaeon]